MTEIETHRLIDTFAEDGKHEDGGNGWCEVAGDGLDVVEELTTLRWLYHRDPCDAHSNQNQDKHSIHSQTQARGDSSSEASIV